MYRTLHTSQKKKYFIDIQQISHLNYKKSVLMDSSYVVKEKLTLRHMPRHRRSPQPWRWTSPTYRAWTRCTTWKPQSHTSWGFFSLEREVNHLIKVNNGYGNFGKEFFKFPYTIKHRSPMVTFYLCFFQKNTIIN